MLFAITLGRRARQVFAAASLERGWNSTPMIMVGEVRYERTKMKRIFEVTADQGLRSRKPPSRLYGDSMGVLGKMSRDS